MPERLAAGISSPLIDGGDIQELGHGQIVGAGADLHRREAIDGQSSNHDLEHEDGGSQRGGLAG